MQELKQRFKELLLNIYPKREGMENLLNYLENETDFFTAPASTKHHGAEAFGLLEHSLQVYDKIEKLIESGVYQDNISPDSVVIAALLHDVCKANFYKIVYRWRKDDSNRWEQYPTYEIDDQLPFGHGEKSVLLLQKYIMLTNEEIAAINWHMGGFDSRAKDYAGMMALSGAMEKFPLAVLLHMADLSATYFAKK